MPLGNASLTYSNLKDNLVCDRLSRILTSNQGFKFRFGSHFGLDIETEYFVFRIVSVYHFGVYRIYIYIYIYIYI